MSFMMMSVILFVASRLNGAVQLLGYALQLPVLLLLPDKVWELTAVGLKGAVNFVTINKPYLGTVQKRGRRHRPLCSPLPLLRLIIFKEATSRRARSPIPFVILTLVTIGPAALSLRRLSSASLVTCVTELLEAGAEAAEARYAWLAPRIAAPARTSLERAARVAAKILVLMIIISRLTPRAFPPSPVLSAAFATVGARPIARLSVGRRTAACVFPLRRTAVMMVSMVMIMSGSAPRSRGPLVRSRLPSKSPLRVAKIVSAKARAAPRPPAAS